jgi:hypothetical protein
MNTRIKTRFATLTSSSQLPRLRDVTMLRKGAASAVFAMGLGAAGLLAPGTAAASPEFADIIRDELAMGCTPQCTICHKDNVGGFGTIKDRSLGATLQGLSPTLSAGDNGRLRSALAELEASDPPVDSDGDGDGDIQELRELRDPSVPGVGDVCTLDVKYGCGARVEPRTPLDWSGALAAGLCALGLGFVVRRRWAR